MKKTFNGSLHLTPDESCRLSKFAARFYFMDSLLTPDELDLVKVIIKTYLNK